jgi:hypothetical protein
MGLCGVIMPKSAVFKINHFTQAYLEQLRNEAKYYSDNIDQSFEKGQLNESHLAAILRRYLPQRFGIGTGFVASANEDNGKSHQSDIIIYDATNNAPIYDSEAFAIYPIEMVYGIIEVKTNANNRRKSTKSNPKVTNELEDAFRKCAHLRSMAQMEATAEDYEAYKEYRKTNTSIHTPLKYGMYFDEKRQKYIKSFKGYIRHKATELGTVRSEFFESLAPRFFIFSYRGWDTAEELHKSFLSATEKFPAAHVHGMCTLSNTGSFYLRHIPHQEGKAKIFDVMEDGFTEFLFSLPQFFDSLLPPHPYRMGLGFDMVNLKRYHVLSQTPDAELPDDQRSSRPPGIS